MSLLHIAIMILKISFSFLAASDDHKVKWSVRHQYQADHGEDLDINLSMGRTWGCAPGALVPRLPGRLETGPRMKEMHNLLSPSLPAVHRLLCGRSHDSNSLESVRCSRFHVGAPLEEMKYIITCGGGFVHHLLLTVYLRALRNKGGQGVHYPMVPICAHILVDYYSAGHKARPAIANPGTYVNVM